MGFDEGKNIFGSTLLIRLIYILSFAVNWPQENVDVVFGGTNKRPTVSKDLYRLLRTLRSDPWLQDRHEMRRAQQATFTKEIIPDTPYMGPNDVYLTV